MVKRLFHIKYSILLCLPFLVLTSCNKDDEDTTYSYNLTATISSFNGISGTSDILSGTWENETEIASLDLTSARKKIIYTNTSTGSTNFNSSSTVSYANGSDVAFFYPASALRMASSDTITQVLTVSGQDGTIKNATKYAYACGIDTIAASNMNRSSVVKISQLMSLGKFTFLSDGSELQNIIKISISATEGSFYSERVYNLEKNYFTSDVVGSNMIISNTSGLSGSATVSLFPCNNVKLRFLITTKSGKVYEAKSDNLLTFKAGEYLDAGVFNCTEINTLAKIGDFFYDDDTWSTTYDSSRKCVGIIFALCNSDGEIDKALTSSAFGKVIGIYDANNSNTCTWSSVSEAIMNRDSIQTVDGNLTQANLIYGSESDYLTSATIDKGTGLITAWPTSGALSDFKAMPFETRYISSYYLASHACYYYRIGKIGYGRWRLPSAGELAMIFELYKSDLINENNHSTFNNFEDGTYWSSTVYGYHKVWAVNFNSGTIFVNSKASSYYVRPVTTF